MGSKTVTASAHKAADTTRRAAFQERMFRALITTMETYTVQIGLDLGLYTILRAEGPLTAPLLAKRAETDVRYTREWLEQQAVAGILDVDRSDDTPDGRRYALPPEHAVVLLDSDDTDFLGFIPPMTTAFGTRVPHVVRAFRNGHGVAWESYGKGLRRAQGDQNRAFLRHVFAPKVLPSLLDVDARLRADPPARVADVACGVGWASIAVAENYPTVSVDGYDLDAAAIREGRREVKARGLSGRVDLQARNAAAPGLRGRYDLVMMVEALHDMAHPVAVLEACRRLLAPGGTVLVVDENTQERFTAPGPDTERAFYGFSVLACLPNGRTEPDSAATGTVMRPDLLEQYASEAGFGQVEIVPFVHDFFRVYRLRP